MTIPVNKIHEMFKEAQFLLNHGEQVGAKIYQLHKRAQEGDPAAQEVIGAAEQGAAIDDQAAAVPAPVEQGDGSQPGTIGPNGMMVCPSCGTQMTPTLDLKCPACGADMSQVIAEGIQEQPPAAGAGAGAEQVPEEAVIDTAEEIKQSAMQNRDILNSLVQNYGYILQ